MGILSKVHNKAFKSDSQRLAVSLRSSIAKRRSHLNAALCVKLELEHHGNNNWDRCRRDHCSGCYASQLFHHRTS
ncbi:hypothetical protein CRN32_03855 [Vibrio vulnificus]|nr:hypothetical protein CRN32_03855 [Vibrio vulnificus]